ncbi:MAG: N-methyl-D-aspartate receptor NMDAR2C subunit [Candidatus Aenigmarchaeota archaeon]|nr:N-methyl-D-aspartate receptor NMDAR2C subunit [Candidatus Aenigmarchaeota archaeon]
MSLLNRWTGLWNRILAKGDAGSVYCRIADMYSEPHRAYHNLRHIEQCLGEFDHACRLAKYPNIVETAIWFHDAVYDPRSDDNEEQSAALSQYVLTVAGISKPFRQKASQLILATKHDIISEETDAKIIIDIDLAIFGKADEEFDMYEAAIRDEYIWVPDDEFATGRSEIIHKFLSRESIYSTDLFREKYEKQARINLERSLSRFR